MITKPLLAVDAGDTSKLKYPVLASPKIDGIRALMIDGKLVSRKFKPIPNAFIREHLEDILPNGVDGEIIVGTTFQECSSGVMSQSGVPNFTYYIFDYVKNSPDDPYGKRIDDMAKMVKLLPSLDALSESNPFKIVPLYPVIINNAEELKEYEVKCLEANYEGVMIRSPSGRYKCGRSTLNEGILLKVKQFIDFEATVIGFEEKLHNDNEAEKDAFGRTKRSTHQENMIPMDTLGAFILQTEDGMVFNCGCLKGFDDAFRKTVWNNRQAYMGKLAKIKSFPGGVKELPRFPVFLGWRHGDDV